MKSAEFVAPYPDHMAPAHIHAGSHSQYIQDAQNWSYAFGRLAHASLSGAAAPSDSIAGRVGEYRAWIYGSDEALRWRASEAKAPQEDHLRVVNETNFHYLNKNMFGMWRPLMMGGWESEKQRRHYIGEAREKLAIEGMVMYTLRKNFAAKRGSATLYNETNRPFLEAINGATQEFDAALVLLDVVQRHAGITVVPAPLQFERSSDGRRNVDFLVVDFIGRRAVGAQVKTNVTDRTKERYDAERVVLIDGSVDFDNVLSVRTKTKSSQQSVKPWPGMIAAKRIQDIPTTGRSMQRGQGGSVVRAKMMARDALGQTRVDYQKAAKRIEERILQKL